MKNTIIIGAGVSGLVAAIELEKKGFAPIILEATDRVGGRVKSDDLEGVPADHGFQVLLTEYPEAKRYLDYDKLDLINFSSGSVVFKNGKMQKIGDPLREISFLWPTIRANIGSVKDKWLILKLSLSLKKKSIQSIFAEPEVTTKEYLLNYGFSDKIIETFFQPFFAGIYLEVELNTSSRMFEFVYKMFGTGNAAIPRKGMQAIPDQLAGQLEHSTIRFNTSVEKIEEQTVFLASGESLTADQIIIATDSAHFYKTERNASLEWKSCFNLYFESSESVLKDTIIGLLPGRDLFVNNFHYLHDVYGESGGDNKAILSVTVVKNNKLSEAEMVLKVKEELQKYGNIETGKLLKIFHIKKALPMISDLKYEPTEVSVAMSSGVFRCGDHLANSSLNAAMASGRVAASLVSKSAT